MGKFWITINHKKSHIIYEYEISRKISELNPSFYRAELRLDQRFHPESKSTNLLLSKYAAARTILDHSEVWGSVCRIILK